jgi:hypothetical protein
LYEDKKEIEYTSDGGGGERTGILPRQRLSSITVIAIVPDAVMKLCFYRIII